LESFYNRLNTDAERRKNDHMRSVEMKKLREMQEEQKMFKPKINKGMPQHIYNGTGRAWQGGKDLEFVLEHEERRLQTFE